MPMTLPRALVLLTCLLALVACNPGEPEEQAWFHDEAQDRGLDFRHQSGASGEFLLPEIMGGGVALADVDGDADLDIYVIQSAGESGNQLFINDGEAHFTRSEAAGFADTGYGMGVTAADYDNDGDVDFYVTNVGPNRLLRNRGDGSFEDVTAAAQVGDAGFSTAATFFDGDQDGDLDLFVVNYVDWRQGIERDCYDYGTGVRNYCDPGNYNRPDQDTLYRNNGDGTFTDISELAGLADAFGNGLGVISADFNGDGLADVFVANDKTMNQLWLNQGGLRFSNEALLWGCAMDDHGIAKAGMGVAAADVDDDGDVDLLVVNIEGETDSYYRNEGGYFADATAVVGLGTVSRGYTRFGVALADFDNDGVLDMYQANGRVTYSPEPEAADIFAEPNVLLRGLNNGRFMPIPRDDTLVHTSRGLAIGDVNHDGGLDMVVMNRDQIPYLLINRNPVRGNWVAFNVVSIQGREALGAVVTGRVNDVVKSRGVQTAGSYLASHQPAVHFGLAGAQVIKGVVVHWPSGESETFGDYNMGKTHRLQQGAGQH
jgi:enediyne biosynthesis protein E4